MKRTERPPAINLTGERIKQARRKRGLSQAGLSGKLELLPVYICRGSISRIENGTRLVSDVEIDAISKVLQVPLDYLFGRSDEMTEE